MSAHNLINLNFYPKIIPTIANQPETRKKVDEEIVFEEIRSSEEDVEETTDKKTIEQNLSKK